MSDQTPGPTPEATPNRANETVRLSAADIQAFIEQEKLITPSDAAAAKDSD